MKYNLFRMRFITLQIHKFPIRLAYLSILQTHKKPQYPKYLIIFADAILALFNYDKKQQIEIKLWKTLYWELQESPAL